MNLPRREIPSVAGLLAFEATARHLSFSRAAEELCLSQGAVSKRIRQLEQAVGVPLLARTRHQVHITEMGRIYLDHVRRFLKDMETTTHALRSGAWQRDAIVLAAPLSFSLRWLMPRLHRYRDAHSGIQIELVTMDRQTSLVPGSGVDCFVHAGRSPIQDAANTRLFNLEWVAVASPDLGAGQRVTGKGDPARLSRIEQTDLPRLWPAWLAQAGADIAALPALRVEGLELAIGAAIAGQGIALLPRPIIDRELGAHELAVLFEGRALVEGGFHLAVPVRLAGDPALCAFARWLECEARGPIYRARAA